MLKVDVWFIFVILLLAAFSIVALFYRGVVLEDFEIMTNDKLDIDILEEGSAY